MHKLGRSEGPQVAQGPWRTTGAAWPLQRSADIEHDMAARTVEKQGVPAERNTEELQSEALRRDGAGEGRRDASRSAMGLRTSLSVERHGWRDRLVGRQQAACSCMQTQDQDAG
jgi:hypothetical protein